MHFHYSFLQDTKLFFPQETALNLSQLDKIEFTALQILKEDSQLDLTQLCELIDHDVQNIKLLDELR